VEFADEASVTNAVALNESLFKGRLIKVNPKRTNLPFFYGSSRGRGSFRGAPRGGAHRPFRGGRGRGGRGRFNPY
jgi:polyadenylate-binding protein 2